MRAITTIVSIASLAVLPVAATAQSAASALPTASAATSKAIAGIVSPVRKGPRVKSEQGFVGPFLIIFGILGAAGLVTWAATSGGSSRG